ncbi:MAG: hypothetical protein WCR55_07955 [Lentisphaerota bacterium]
MLPTKKTILSAVAAVGFCAMLGTVCADIDVSKFKTPKEFKGKVVSLSSTTVRMGLDFQWYKGKVIYVAPPGTKFKGPIFDLKGNVVTQGDVLIKLDTKACEALLDQATASLNSKESLYKRYQVVVDKAGAAGSSISEQALLEAKNDYLVAKADFILKQGMLSTCTFNAQFDGVVDEVLFPGGYTNLSDREVMKVSQLAPIGVEVQISREEAFTYGVQTPIAIFPLGHKEAIGPYRGGSMVSSDANANTLTFIVSNHRDFIKTKKLENGQEVPVVRNICPVIPFSDEDLKGALSVYENSIMKDDKGNYVMQVVGQNATYAINPVFKLKKVYITMANEVSHIETSVKYVKLQDAGGLAVNDTLLPAEECKGLNDGSVVYFEKTRYMFLPGDPVKVIIDTAVTNEKVGLEPGQY